MKKELISSDPEQSFRFFSWKRGLHDVLLFQGDVPPVQIEGVGNVWHYHPEVELTLFTSGEGIRYVGDDVKSFKAPDLVLLGSNLPHYWTVGECSGYCIQFLLDPASPLAGLHESGNIKRLLKDADKGLKFSNEHVSDILLMLEECERASSLKRLSLFLNIVDALSRLPATNISSYVPQGLVGSKSTVVKKAVHYILKNATNAELELQDVLDYSEMSRPTFSRHFQRTFGQSYTQFLQSVRLENVRNMLVATDKSVTEIAYSAGFSNLSHFNKIFKLRFSMSPRELRALIRE